MVKKKVVVKKPASKKAKGADARVADAFSNGAARMGAGTSSLANGTDYTMERISLNYWLLLTLYCNHWISRRIVDGPAEDMLRAWPKLQCELSPNDMKAFDRTIDRTGTQSKLMSAVKWARLFGGAGALMVIKGHENILDEPLDVEDVRPGSYQGLIPFDRWSGITPGAEVSDNFEFPRNFGLPEFYTVRGEGATSFKVHHSRVLRFTGPDVPSPEYQVQSRWGISVLEVVYDEMKKRDNASWSILNLMFRAQLLALRDPELKQKLSGLGMSQMASQAFAQQLAAQNEMMSNQSMVLLGKDGGLETHQYSFGGLAEVYQQFQLDISGAAEYPMTRLFGRTMTGLGQSNDGDERIYEEKIAARQHNELKPQFDRLFPVVCMSEFGEVPDDLDYTFPSVRVLTEEEKSELAKSNSDAVIAAFNAGIISQRKVLQELQQASATTGIFTNITDEDIAAASDKTQAAGEMDLGGMGAPEAAEGHQEPPSEAAERSGSEDDVQELQDVVRASDGVPLESRFAAGNALDVIERTHRFGRAGDEDRPNGQVIELGGLRIGVENSRGSVRSGTADDGKRWSVRYQHPYGYIEGFKGVDGDSLDCCVGPHRDSKTVFVIHQNKLDGSYDDDKVMLGYRTAKEAKDAYFAHYDRPEAFFGPMETLPLGVFKKRITQTARLRDELLAVTGQLEDGADPDECDFCGDDLNGDDYLERRGKIACPDCADAMDRKALAARVFDADAEFVESKHPRKDNGQFGKGSGGTAPAKSASKVDKSKLQYKTAGAFVLAAVAQGGMTKEEIAEAASAIYGTKTSVASVNWYLNTAKKKSPKGQLALNAKHEAQEANNEAVKLYAKQEKKPGTKDLFVSGHLNGKKVFVRINGAPTNDVDVLNKFLLSKNINPSGMTPVEYDPSKPAPPELKTFDLSSDEVEKFEKLAKMMKDEKDAAAQAKVKAEEDKMATATKKSSQKLQAQHIKAVKGYTNGEYKAMNAALRTGDSLDSSQKALVAHLDEAIGVSALKKDITLYRGIAKPQLFFGPYLKEGTIVTDAGFISTSRNRSTAENFSSNQFVIEIKAKAGQTALDVAPIGVAPSESEIVLPRSAKFKIVGIRADKTVEVEYV